MTPQTTRRPGRLTCAPTELLEPLEPRTLLSPTPLPNPADMEDPSNPVVRLNTSMGDIDIELLQNRVPAVIATFFDNLERGASDQTFFHRLTPGVSLQGGLFGFVGNLWALPVCQPFDNPPGPGPANTVRTIAAGQLGESGQLATTTFIINLRDNPALDPGRIVVFARVLDDRSWAVVQQIASLPVADLANDSGFAGLFGGSLHQVPVRGPYDPGDPNDPDHPPQTVTPDLLVQTYDLQILKAPGASNFYRSTIFGPEGYFDSTIHEFIPIENPSDQPVYYELTARYEPFGTSPIVRDFTIDRGVIAPHSRGGVTLVENRDPGPGHIRYANQPFAMELRSTAPLAATLSHYDFGSTIAQPFSDNTAQTWIFPDSVKAANIFDFIVWYNPGGDNSVVTVTLTDQSGNELPPLTFNTDRYRRGGISLQGQSAIPDGVYSVRIDSTQPIAISRSHYASSGPPRNRPEGFSQNGALGDPSTRGVVAIAADPGTHPVDAGTPTLFFSAFNPGAVPATITINLYRPGSAFPAISIPAALVVNPGQHATFSRALPQAQGDNFTLVYSATAPIYASYSMLRSESAYGGAVAATAATDYHFAEGFTDPSRVQPNVLEEVIHVFNPYAAALGSPTTRDAHVRYTFRFTDGFTLSLDHTIQGGTTDRVAVSSLQQIIDQANQNGRYFYSIEVSSDIAVVAQMMHTDATLGGDPGNPSGGGFLVSGTIFGPLTRLDNLG